MATYLNKDFDATKYANFRPSYPQKLFNYIKSYHAKNSGTDVSLAVDLACGTGMATKDIAKFSKTCVGVDHSKVMIEEARKQFANENIEFKIGVDLTLKSLFEPNSVDLLSVAEAAHYFHYPQFWEQANSVLKSGGTLAIFSYWTFAFPDYPEVSKIIYEYAMGDEMCGPFFDSGIELLDTNYKALLDTMPSEFKAIEYRVNDFDQFRKDEPFEMVKENVKVGSMINLLKTWSPYYNWKRANPNKKDIADKTMELIHEATGLTLDDEVNVKWKTIILLATKR